MDSVMKELIGAMHRRIFGLEPPLGESKHFEGDKPDDQDAQISVTKRRYRGLSRKKIKISSCKSVHFLATSA